MDANISIKRYPTTKNRSLKAWSAADEHILKYLKEEDVYVTKPIVYNDRFGYLCTHLNKTNPIVICNYKSQEKAIQANIKANNINSEISIIHELQNFSRISNLAIIKIPKSIDLFELQLSNIHKHLSTDGIVVCAFMTKHFSPQLLKIVHQYFEEYKQSRAWKKSRLLLLKNKKTSPQKNFVHNITLTNKSIFYQFFGVFSAKKIDFASQFFIQNLTLKPTAKNVLDLASGNGIIAYYGYLQNPKSHFHLLDDSILAIESSKLNIQEGNFQFHYNNCLEDIEDDSIDLVLSNPPFHFDHENNIEVALDLFKEVKRKLVLNGEFQMVTSKHLNLYTHLSKLFSRTEVFKENDKFIIYHCKK